jgi:prophage maintenance system killer protein
VFLDGNKRTALLAMLTFLRANAVVLTARDDDLADCILDLSRGGSLETLATRIRSSMSRR